MVKLLDDKNPEVQNEVPMTLGKIGPAAKDAVPALIKALAEKEGHVRYGVAYALGRIGPAAAEAVPALVQGVGREGRVAAADRRLGVGQHRAEEREDRGQDRAGPDPRPERQGGRSSARAPPRD